MTDTPQLLLVHHLKTLKLPTFLREYDKLARQGAAEGADPVRDLAEGPTEATETGQAVAQRRILKDLEKENGRLRKAISDLTSAAVLAQSRLVL